MPVGPNRSLCRAYRVAVLVLFVGLALASAGCASDRVAANPTPPDQSVLDPATQALDKAVQAHADQFAPQSVAAARRRITLARDVLFTAAREGRPVTSAEQDDIDALVDSARLDAREALIETQAKAVANQIERMKNPPQQSGSSANGAMNAPATAGPANGPLGGA